MDQDSFEQIVKCWEANNEYFIPTIGVHPTEVNDKSLKSLLEFIDNNIDRIPVKAIGETGLDLYWDKTFIDYQIDALKYQIELSLKTELPIIIHVRDAFEPLHKVLSEYKGCGMKGVIHSFSGTEEDVDKILDIGDFFFGINGVVTFKKSHLPEVVKHIGVDKIIVETDAPYLSPVPWRGKRNEPSYMLKTAEKLSDIFDTSVEEIDKLTTLNTLKLFNC